MAAVLRKLLAKKKATLFYINQTSARLFSEDVCSNKTITGPVGFIGLGNMGSHMSSHLLKKGHTLIVYDVNPEAVNVVQEAGAIASHSPAEVAERTEWIITMLPSTPHVTEVYLGEKGILQTVKPGTILIDCSTIDPSKAKEVSNYAHKKGTTYVDAPVSGGVTAAKAGTLTFMVGGPERTFHAAKTLLSCMGQKIVHCGEVGTGQAVKICNNMLLAISMIGTAETMNLGIRLGLDPTILADVINTSTGRCWSSQIYNPVPGVTEGAPANNNYQGGFSTFLMNKDLGLAQNAATTTQSSIPLGSFANQLYRIMTQKGFSNKDFSSVYQFLQETANE